MASSTTSKKNQKVAPYKRRKSWKALRDHYKEVSAIHLRDLFAQDPGRGERLTAEHAGVFLDYSKNRVSDETLKMLFELAEESGLRQRIDAMFRGDKINVTENRAVLHVALRAPKRLSADHVDGERRCAPGARSAGQDGRFFQPCTKRGVERPKWKTHS